MQYSNLSDKLRVKNIHPSAFESLPPQIRPEDFFCTGGERSLPYPAA